MKQPQEYSGQDLRAEFEWNLLFTSCKISTASFTKRGSKLTSVKATHGKTKTKAVNETIFSNTEVHYIPQGLNEIFPLLTRLEITCCGLKEISRFDLNGLERLTEISLADNHLEYLPDDLFKGMVNMTKVKLSNNRLERVSSKTFDPIKNQIIWLDLQNNPCIHVCYSKNSENLNAVRTIEKLMEVIENSSHANLFKQNFTEGFAQLWESKKLWDFVITVGKRKFHVHRIVLAVQSSVFDEMFEKIMKQRENNCTTVQGFSENAVERFLRYFYTGDVPDISCAIEVHELATKYNVLNLKLSCVDVITNRLDINNAYEVFAYAHRSSLKDTKKLAFDKICEMFPDKPLNKNLIEQPDRLKKLIDNKIQLELELESVNKDLYAGN